MEWQSALRLPEAEREEKRASCFTREVEMTEKRKETAPDAANAANPPPIEEAEVRDPARGVQPPARAEEVDRAAGDAGGLDVGPQRADAAEKRAGPISKQVRR